MIGFILSANSGWSWLPEVLFRPNGKSVMMVSGVSFGQQKEVSWHVYHVSSISLLGLRGLQCHRT